MQGAVHAASANKASSAGSSNPTPPPTSLTLEQAGEIIADSYSCRGPPRTRSYFTSPEPLHEPSVEHSPVPIAPPAVPIVAPALPAATTTGADEAISDLSDLDPEDQPVKSINMSKKKPRCWFSGKHACSHRCKRTTTILCFFCVEHVRFYSLCRTATLLLYSTLFTTFT